MHAGASDLRSWETKFNAHTPHTLTQRLRCKCPWKVWWTRESWTKDGKWIVEKQELTLSSELAWRCLDGPATGHAGRQWQHGARGEGTSTSPVVWSLSAPGPPGGSSTPLSWIPKAKGNKRGYITTELLWRHHRMHWFHLNNTHRNKSWVHDAIVYFVCGYKECSPNIREKKRYFQRNEKRT